DGTFDLVFSTLTLQHLPPRVALRYVTEFGRVLRPGGLALFQAASRPYRDPARRRHPLLGPAARLVTRGCRELRLLWRRSLRGEPVMDMYGLRPTAVRRALERAGCRLLEQWADGSAGPEWEGLAYLARRNSSG